MSKTNKACQNIYDKDNNIIFDGGWDCKDIFSIIKDQIIWKGLKVLDIGSNTSGLSLEIAREGAHVIAAEPDPYKNTISLTKNLIEDLILKENLSMELVDNDFSTIHKLGSFDVIICFGLIYHFKNPQFLIDYLNQNMKINSKLFISTQTYSSDKLIMINRMDEEVLKKKIIETNNKCILSGWHITRNLFNKMLQTSGFNNIKLLTKPCDFPEKSKKFLTNSAYYIAEKNKNLDVSENFKYYPR